MPYTPRDTAGLLRALAARVVARTDLTDISEGSDLHLLLYAVAQGYASIELLAARFRDSFSLEDATGEFLDRRVEDLPPVGARRLSASAASGGNLTLGRTDTAGDLTVPAGSTYGRTDDGTLIYRQISDAEFLDGQDSALNVAVVCLIPGSVGNAGSGTIDRVVSAPGVTSVTNRLALSNGNDSESDESLRARALAYLSSLTGTTPAALEYLGRSFTSSDNTRARFVRVFEDLTVPAYAELLVDDGSSLIGYVRQGAVSTGTAPAGGPPVLWHESPATEPIDTISVTSGGNTRQLAADEYDSFPERGLVYVKDGVLSPGDSWEISKYSVWVGYPAELQALLEGSVQAPLESPGNRAAGTRVRVVAPLAHNIPLWVNVVPRSGRSLELVAEDARTSIVEYIATLGPGETLFMSRLTAHLIENDDILAVRFFEGAGGDGCARDHIPPSPRHVLRTEDGLISIVPLPQEG